MGKIANMYLDWNIMVVNGHRMVDELVARRAIDIAKEESELQQDVVRRDAPSDSIELCGEFGRRRLREERPPLLHMGGCNGCREVCREALADPEGMEGIMRSRLDLGRWTKGPLVRG